MSIYFLVGREANVIESAETKTVSSEDSDFPKENAFNRFPGSVFKFEETDETDATYDIDLNRLLNGGFETWAIASVPDDWDDVSSGSATLEEDQTIEVEGSSCLKLIGTDSDNKGGAQQILYIPSGWKCTLDGRLRGDGADALLFQVKCLETGQWLDNNGDWQDTTQDVYSKTAGSWTASDPVTFTVPSISITQRHLMTIQCLLVTEGTGYADAFSFFPWVDFASVHGHNLPISGALVFKVQHDTVSNFATPTTQTMTITRPTFWKVFTQVGERYWRFFADGDNPLQGKYGELVLGQYGTLTPDFQAGAKVTFTMSKTIATALNKQTFTTVHSDEPQREYTLTFRALTEAQKDLVRQEILLRSNYGKDPLILVPDSNNEDVIYGKVIDSSWIYTRMPFGAEAKGIYDYSIKVREDPFGKEIN